MLEGLPGDVRNKVEENLDLDGANKPRWVRHIMHHMTAYQKKKQQKKEEMGGAADKLTRLNLAETCGQANVEKKTTKSV